MLANPAMAEPAAAPWPVASLALIQARLTAPGERFEMEEIVVDGRLTRSWKNATPTVVELLATARTHGDLEFILYEDERVSYDAFHRATARLAHWLRDRGVGNGDRVAVAMVNLPEWPVAAFAAASLGAIIVPLNAWWTGRELNYGLADSGARALFADAERLARIEPYFAGLTDLTTVVVSRSKGETAGAIALGDIIGPASSWKALPDIELPAVEIAPDDPFTLFYTSGTTGEPKGALGSHRNALSNPLSTAYSAHRSALRRGDPPPEP